MQDLIPEGDVCKRKLQVCNPLPNWIYDSVAWVGEACHPTLTHLNQYIAQASEDAVVNGLVLWKILDVLQNIHQ